MGLSTPVICLVLLLVLNVGSALRTNAQHYSRLRTALQAQRNILGQSIVNCRKFSIKEPKTFTFTGSYATLNSVPQYSFPDVAFVGKSNVGKSSLLNTLTGLRKKIAVEGRTPGTTQRINIFQCSDRSGSICNFVDLPGYGYAKLSDEQQSGISSFMRDYLLARGSLKLVLMLVDSRREADAADLEMLQVGHAS
jgi:ribosome biogenesis GTP-binding protein YsxC/EngB